MPSAAMSVSSMARVLRIIQRFLKAGGDAERAEQIAKSPDTPADRAVDVEKGIRHRGIRQRRRIIQALDIRGRNEDLRHVGEMVAKVTRRAGCGLKRASQPRKPGTPSRSGKCSLLYQNSNSAVRCSRLRPRLLARLPPRLPSSLSPRGLCSAARLSGGIATIPRSRATRAGCN